MKGKKILAVFMTVFMMLSLLPSMVFAAAVPSGELGGKLKIKGAAAVGVTLSADYGKVTPEGVTDDYVSFKWSRKNGEELTELGTEKTYKVTEEDLGLEIVLEVTGAEAQGVTGKLTATTCPVAATEEEAEQHKAEQHAEEAENGAETEEVPENSGEQPEEGWIKVKVDSVAKLPFEHKYFLKESEEQEDVCWFVQRDLWDVLEKKGMPGWLKIPEEKLLLLK